MFKREEIIPQKPGIKPNITKLESTGYLLKDLGECHKWYYNRVWDSLTKTSDLQVSNIYIFIINVC
jgi:hypothetical protein